MYCNVMVYVGFWVNKYDKIGFYKLLFKYLQNFQYVVFIESLFYKVYYVVLDNCLFRCFEIFCLYGGYKGEVSDFKIWLDKYLVQ